MQHDRIIGCKVDEPDDGHAHGHGDAEPQPSSCEFEERIQSADDNEKDEDGPRRTEIEGHITALDHDVGIVGADGEEERQEGANRQGAPREWLMILRLVVYYRYAAHR